MVKYIIAFMLFSPAVICHQLIVTNQFVSTESAQKRPYVIIFKETKPKEREKNKQKAGIVPHLQFKGVETSLIDCFVAPKPLFRQKKENELFQSSPCCLRVPPRLSISKSASQTITKKN